MNKQLTSHCSRRDLPSWQWVRETPVAILEENELPAWKEPQEVVAMMRDLGATFLRYPAIGWGAHFYGQSEFLPKYPLIDAERDLYGQIDREIRKHGMRIMAYCHYGVLYRELEQTHPQWLARDAAGEPLLWSGNYFHHLCCLCHDGFRKAMQNAIREMAARYKPDAVYLDGPAWYGACFCEDCRRQYWDEYHEELPAVLSTADHSLQRMKRLRDKVTVAAIAGVRAALQEVHACPLLFNTAPHHKASAEDGMRFADGANTTEVHRPGSFWEILECVKLGESFKKTSLCYLPPGPYDTLRSYDNDEVDVFGAAYLMHGATAMLQSPLAFLRDRTGVDRIRGFMQKVSRHAPVYCRAEPVKEIGLVFSRLAHDYALEEPRYSEETIFSGAFQALLHGHRHFDCMFDTQLCARRLAGYRVIYLPGGKALSRQQAATLREFVKNGGTLIAGGCCGMLDEEGNSRTAFPLADVLGVELVGTRPEMRKLSREYRETGPAHGYSPVPEAYLQLQSPHLLTGNLQPGHLIPVSDAVVGVPDLERYVEYTLVKIGKDTRVLADLFLPAGGGNGEDLEFPFGSPPGITVRQYGKGRAIYLAASLAAAYFRRRLPDIRNLLIAVMDFGLDHRPQVTLDAPSGVILNLTRDNACDYLHLLNYCGPMFERGNPVDTIIPVHDLVLRYQCPGNAVKATTLYGQQRLEVSVEDGYAVIRLPRLDICETIRLEPERP